MRWWWQTIFQIWQLSLCFYVCKPPSIHPLYCCFLLLKWGRMCLHHLCSQAQGMIHFWSNYTSRGGVSGPVPSPWGFTLSIQMPTLCKLCATVTAPACHFINISWPQLQQPCHNSLALPLTLNVLLWVTDTLGILWLKKWASLHEVVNNNRITS